MKLFIFNSILLIVVLSIILSCNNYYIENNRDSTFPIRVQKEISLSKVEIRIKKISAGYTTNIPNFDEFRNEFSSNDGNLSLAINLEFNKTTKIVTGSGSGVVLTHDGIILTNHHVIKTDPTQLEVVLRTGDKEVTHRAQLISYTHYGQKGNDLALIKVNAKFKNVVRLGKAQQIKVRTKVYNWGYPGGLSTTSLGNNYSSGYISRTNFIIPFFGKQPKFVMDIKGAGGVSGSGIYAKDGRLIGLMQGSIFYGRWMVGIPIDQIRRFLDERQIPYQT